MISAANSSTRVGVIILGNSGSGKSFLANVLLNQEAFEHAYKPCAVTTKTEFKECTEKGKVYAIYNIPGLIEADQERIEINKREIDAAFKKDEHAVVVYVFQSAGGRIRNEDVAAFNAINDAYPLKEKSVVIVVNKVDANRPANYDKDTIEYLKVLLNFHISYSCFLNHTTTEKKHLFRPQLLEKITMAEPKKHIKQHDIQLYAAEISKLTKQIADFQQQIQVNRHMYEMELQRIKKEFVEKEREMWMRQQQTIHPTNTSSKTWTNSSDSGLQVIDNVLTAPLDVVRGTTHGFVDGVAYMSKPFADFIEDDSNNAILRAGAVPVGAFAAAGGAVGGAVVGTVRGVAKGVERVLGSVFK